MPTFNKENRDVINAFSDDFNRPLSASHFLHHPAEKINGSINHELNPMMGHVEPGTFRKPIASPFGSSFGHAMRPALSPTRRSDQSTEQSYGEPTPRNSSKPFFRGRSYTDENAQLIALNNQNILFHARANMASNTTVVSREAPSPANHVQALALDPQSFISPASQQPRVPPVTPAASMASHQSINSFGTPKKQLVDDQSEPLMVRRIPQNPFNQNPFNLKQNKDNASHVEDVHKHVAPFVSSHIENATKPATFASSRVDDTCTPATLASTDQDSMRTDSDVSDLTIDGDESVPEYRPITMYLIRELCGFMSRPGDEELMNYWEHQPREALLTAYQHALSMSFNQAIDQTKDTFLMQMKHDSEIHHKELETAKKRIIELEQQNDQKQRALSLSQPPPSHNVMHRQEVRSLQREIEGLKQELAIQREHSNQQLVARVAEARTEIMSKWDEEKRLRETRKAERKARHKEREHAQEQVEDFLNNSGMSLSTSVNQSINNTIRHNMTLNNSLAMNISTMAAAVQPLRTITMRVTLESPSLIKCAGDLSVHLFSRSAAHSIIQFQSKTSRQSLATNPQQQSNSINNNQLQLNPPLCWTRASTWLSHSGVRLSLYDVTVIDLNNGEQREQPTELGSVELDSYKLFTSWADNGAMNGVVSNAEMRARETIDTRAGKSERLISVPIKMLNGSTNSMECPRLIIHATITPPMTVDAYPPPPSMKLAGPLNQSMNLSLLENPLVTLNLSGLNSSMMHERSFQAGESFAVDEPASPILKHELGKPRGSLSPLKPTMCEMACQTEHVEFVQPVVVKLMSEMSVQTDSTLTSTRDACVQSESSSSSISTQTADIDHKTTRKQAESGTMTDSEDVSTSLTLTSVIATQSSLNTSMESSQPFNPAFATFSALSSTLQVSYPFGTSKLTPATQTQLQRVYALIRRQWRDTLQWIPRDEESQVTKLSIQTTKQSIKDSKSSAKSNPIWNPSNKPNSHLHLKQQQAIADVRNQLHWNADTQSSACYCCTRSFSFLVRRHSCRLCGAAACDDCSKKTVDLSEYGLTGHQRVCDLCETTWNIAKGVKHVQPNIVNTGNMPPKEAARVTKKSASVHSLINEPGTPKITVRSSSPAPSVHVKTSATSVRSSSPAPDAHAKVTSIAFDRPAMRARPTGIPKPAPRAALAATTTTLPMSRRTIPLKSKSINQQ